MEIEPKIKQEMEDTTLPQKQEQKEVLEKEEQTESTEKKLVSQDKVDQAFIKNKNKTKKIVSELKNKEQENLDLLERLRQLELKEQERESEKLMNEKVLLNQKQKEIENLISEQADPNYLEEVKTLLDIQFQKNGKTITETSKEELETKLNEVFKKFPDAKKSGILSIKNLNKGEQEDVQPDTQQGNYTFNGTKIDMTTEDLQKLPP